MKEFKQTITAYEGYYKARKQIDRNYLAASEEAKQYNVQTASEMEAKAVTNKNVSAAALRHEYNDKLAAILAVVKSFVGSKFSLSLTPEDEATLTNLEKIKLSDSEMKLQLEKFKNNPLALRRLAAIYDGNDSEMLQIFSQAKGYDYFVGLYKDFMGLAVAGMNALDGTDPRYVDNQFESIDADLALAALEKNLPELEKQFAPLEGKEAETVETKD
ncbi:hypothetical protein ACYSNU_12095 [Enterococcus sp. LJL120]